MTTNTANTAAFKANSTPILYPPSTVVSELKFGLIASKVIDIETDYELTADGLINPFNKANKPLTTNWVQNLLKKYGIYQNINNLELYQQAFIHTSYTVPYVREVCLRDNVMIKENPDGCMLLAQKSYERMEFLGDTIIDAIIGNYVFTRFPDGSEGFLSTMKKQLVSRWTLGHLAEKCGFGEYMVISKTMDDKQGARNDIKKLCDVLEAFIAAIYLDFNREKHGFLASFLSGPGFQVAEKFLIQLIEAPDTYLDMTALITDDGNYKIKLRNYYRRTRQTDLIYTLSEESSGIWQCQITTKRNRDTIIATGTGKDKKEAEYTCAYVGLKSLGLVD
jgi:ribonuclease-3